MKSNAGWFVKVGGKSGPEGVQEAYREKVKKTTGEGSGRKHGTGRTRIMTKEVKRSRENIPKT